MTNAIELSDDLRDFYLRSHRVIDAMMRAEGASLARAKLLGFIRRAGPVRSADVLTEFELAPRTVTEALDRLEREGLIARAPDPADRRAKRISITEAGVEALAGAERARHALTDAVFGVLSAEEMAALSATIRKMNGKLATLDGRGAGEVCVHG
ncbi:MAG: MarR family transcriptional regulator [Sphingomonas fennica]